MGNAASPGNSVKSLQHAKEIAERKYNTLTEKLDSLKKNLEDAEFTQLKHRLNEHGTGENPNEQEKLKKIVELLKNKYDSAKTAHEKAESMFHDATIALTEAQATRYIITFVPPQQEQIDYWSDLGGQFEDGVRLAIAKCNISKDTMLKPTKITSTADEPLPYITAFIYTGDTEDTKKRVEARKLPDEGINKLSFELLTEGEITDTKLESLGEQLMQHVKTGGDGFTVLFSWSDKGIKFEINLPKGRLKMASGDGTLFEDVFQKTFMSPDMSFHKELKKKIDQLDVEYDADFDSWYDEWEALQKNGFVKLDTKTTAANVMWVKTGFSISKNDVDRFKSALQESVHDARMSWNKQHGRNPIYLRMWLQNNAKEDLLTIVTSE